MPSQAGIERARALLRGDGFLGGLRRRAEGLVSAGEEVGELGVHGVREALGGLERGARFLEERGEAVRGSLRGADLPGEFGPGVPGAVPGALQAASESLPEVRPEVAQSIPGRVVGAVGQVAPALPLGALGGMQAAGIYGAIQEGQGRYEEVIQRLGESEDSYQKAQTARLVGEGLGLLEALPVAKVLGRLDRASGGLAGRLLGLYGRLPSAVGGGLTEGLQSALGDLAVEHLTGQDIDVLRNAAEEAVYGGAAFGILGAFGKAFRRQDGGQEGALPQEALRAPERGAAEPKRKERELMRSVPRGPSTAVAEDPEARRFSELLNEASDEDFEAAVSRMSPEESSRLIEKMGQYLLPRGEQLQQAVDLQLAGHGAPALEAEIRERVGRSFEVALREEDQESLSRPARGTEVEPEGFVTRPILVEGKPSRQSLPPGHRALRASREQLEAREDQDRLVEMQAFPGNLLPDRKKPRAQVQTDESFGLPDERLRDVLYRKLADKFAPIKQIEKASERAGMPVLEHERGYQAEELFSSRAKARLDEAERSYLDPIKRHLTKRGVTLSRVDDYLTAIVAPEVNRVVSERRGREVYRRLSPRARKRIKALESAFGQKEAKLNTELVRRQKALERRANRQVRRLFSRLEGRSRTRANRLRRRLRVRLRRLGRQYQEKLYAIDDDVDARLAELRERGKTTEQIARAKRRLERRAQERKELAAASYRRKVLKVENRYFRDIEDVDRVFGKRIAEAEQRLSEDVELREARELIAAEVSGRIERLRRRRLERLTKIDAELGRRVAEAMVNERRGAGMTDADAALVREEIESGPRAAEYRELAALIRRVNDQRLDLMVRYELISQETADEWRELYPNYVPLRSFSRNLRGFTPARTGRGMGVRGPESKRRRGRISRADSPLIYSLLQLDETIIRGEKNLVAQSLVQFFDGRPSEHWQVSEGRGQVEFNEITGEVETARHDPRFQLAELSFAAKFRGREVIVTFDRDSKLLASAIKNMGEAEVGDALKYLRAGMRVMSKLATAYNPEFMLANFEKDLQTAGIHLAATEEGRRAWRKAFHPKAIGGAIRAGYDGLRQGEATGAWRAWWERYRLSGAKIDWYYSESAEQRLERLNKDIEKLKNPDSKAWETIQTVAEWVDNANGAIENGVRLSAFRALVQNGTSEADAASFVKNMTVNFTRRGEWGSVGNTLYLFWQAGISGNVTLIRNLKRSKVVRAVAGGLIAEGLIMDIVNRMLSPEDEDGNNVYDTIPDWIKEHNFVLMIPGTRKALMFPLPWGYNVFHNLGRSVGSVVHGGRRVQDGMFSAWRAGVQAFNPLGGEATLAQLISPTIFDPFVALGENRTFAGTPVTRENYEFGFQRPDSELYWNSTGRPYVRAAQVLNKLTGGDEATRGLVDVSPDTMEYIVEFATKGAGSFVRRLEGLFETGFNTPASEVPFLRRQLWSQAEWQSRSQYYDNRHEIDQAKGRKRLWERQIEEGVRVPYARAKLRQTDREVGWLLELEGELRRVERALKRADDEAERRALQQAFNRMVNEARSRAR